MGTIADKLDYLNDTKDAIKTAIENKGVTVGANDTFRSYANKINNIQIGSSNVLNTISARTSSSTPSDFANYIRKIPKDVVVSGTDLSYTFMGCTGLVEVEEFDTSSVTKFGSLFNGCTSLTYVPSLNTSNVTAFNGTFRDCTALTTILELDFSSATNILTMIYGSTTSLTTLGGFTNLGQAYLTTQSANYNFYTLDLSANTSITHDSLMNVINKLYDIATKGVATQSLTLGNTNLAKLTSAEIQIATNKGWSVS